VLCCALFLFGTATLAAEAGGFIAQSESGMNWADAKAFCEQKGGRLPLSGGSASIGKAPEKGTAVEGFGALGDAPWPSALPNNRFWTGTEDSGYPAESWTIIGVSGGGFSVRPAPKKESCRAVCVPK
jgi:hypothetical protein